jgi:hypothetical protein
MIILVPDTNSLLAAFDPIEYRKVSGENSFVFMILPTVLGERDRLKVEHRNPDVREKAKKVITRIKGWRNQGPLAKGVTVDKTITVKALHTEPNMKATLSWLDSDNRDDLFRRLRQLEPCCLSAFPGNNEITRYRLFPDLEGMRLAGLARCEHPDLRSRGIKFRVVRHQDGRVRRCRSSGHLALGLDVDIEVRGRAGEVERRAT